MKKVIIIIGSVFLLFFLIVAGCNNDGQYPSCYEGKVVSLNHGDGCNNIIEIVKAINNDGLSTGSTITFNPDLYEGTLKVGDVVYFKIIQYEKWVGPGTANCLWPGFIGQIEFCNN